LEQIVLYLAVLVALLGFGMGLINLAGPFLKRLSIALPSLNLATLLRRGAQDEDDDDLDLDLDAEEDLSAARDFAESSFVASENTLLARRRSVALGDDDEDLDEELVEVLEEVAQEDYEPADDDVPEGDDDGPVIYTVSVEDIDAVEDEENDEVSEADEDTEDEEDDDEDEEDDEEGDEEEDAAAEIQTVAAGAGEGDDMMSFFGESADAGAGAIAAWRKDLAEVSIEELLAEARAIRQQIQGKKSNAA
jgi:hypothetical protein